jgi:hypothetical protein
LTLPGDGRERERGILSFLKGYLLLLGIKDIGIFAGRDNLLSKSVDELPIYMFCLQLFTPVYWCIYSVYFHLCLTYLSYSTVTEWDRGRGIGEYVFVFVV